MATVNDDGHGTGGDGHEDRSNTKSTIGARLKNLSYGEAVPDAQGRQFYNDPTTSGAVSRGHYIEIYHIISKTSLFFKALLTDFSDNFNVSHNKEQVFGRTDPVITYQNTERIINVAFSVVASNLQEARANMEKANHFASMMYPAYGGDKQSSSTNLKAGPMFRVKLGNLICKPGLSEAEGTTPAENAGLTCAIGGFKYNPSLDEGFFDPEPGILYPQAITIDLELSVIHEQKLGYGPDGTRREPGRYPYGGERAPHPPAIPPANPDTLKQEELQGEDFESKRQLIRNASISTELKLQRDLMRARYEVQKTKMLSPVRKLEKLFGTISRTGGDS